MERRNRRPFGALRATHLLDHRHHRPPLRPHPCEPGCDFYRPEWAQNSRQALLTARGEIAVEAGDAVVFTHSCGCECGDHVYLQEPGVYYAHFALHMPGGQTVNGHMHLALDDHPLPDSLIRLEHAGALTEHASGHAMFYIDHPTCLRLVPQQALNMRTDDPEPLITLAVFRI